jgi:hypothetical protein
MENIEKNQIQEENEFYSTNAIDKIREFMAILENFLQKEQIKIGARKELEEILKKVREILRVEVDERISSERADAVEKRDLEWNQTIEQNYVKKEMETELKKRIQSDEAIIKRLMNENAEKDNAHEKDQTDICNHLSKERYLENQIQCLSSEKKALNDKNWELHNYIENRLDNEVRQGQAQLGYEQEKLTTKITYFDKHVEIQRTNINAMFQEVEQQRKNVETRENKVAEQEEKIQKQENELEAAKNRWNKQYSEITTLIKTRVEEIAYAHCENMVKKCFDKQINEINQQWKEIKDQTEQITKERENLKKTAEEQRIEEERLQKLQILLEKTQEKQKYTIVHPEQCSGSPIVRSGFSP